MRLGELTEIKSVTHDWVHNLGGVILWLAISVTIEFSSGKHSSVIRLSYLRIKPIN